MRKSEKKEYDKVYRPRNKVRNKLRYERVVAARKALLVEMKKRPCPDCGKVWPPECMEFDHTVGEKRFCISGGLSYGNKVFYEELAKGEFVCACCHKLRSVERGQFMQSGKRSAPQPPPPVSPQLGLGI